MIKRFIERPILSLVISLFFLLIGALALFTLPVTQFPDIVPPSVVVTAKYTGANAEVASKAVATPIERAINGVPGMTYMSTVCSNDGNTLITVFFEVGTDPDVAAVNVQNRVTTILDELPEEVIKAGVITEKEVNSMLMYLNLYSTDENSDEKFIYNFADINVLTELKRINGVGFAEIMGARDYSMRVWLKPDRMAVYDISTDDVIDAIRKQNVEAAPGKTGISSSKEAQELQYVLKYTGKFSMPVQYENIILRANEDGSFLRLKDIADVEFGSQDYHMASKVNGKFSASIMLKQRPGSNARDVINNVKEKMVELKETSFPPGVEFNITYDVSRFLDASISEVLKTLLEAFILVFIVVYIFLQDFRSTIIPALAVPVSLVGTFAFMQLFGFSINLLTLFALVLAIGIVVDNAIVVVEAVHAKMHDEHLDSRKATFAAMKEMGGAIISITLVMSAVFIPVAFASGPVGIFYRQFSLTLAIAIVISGINALTLTPALCAIMLRSSHTHYPKKNLMNRFFNSFNKGYDKLQSRYGRLVNVIAGRRSITIGALVLFLVAIVGINGVLPSGFIPTEDQGVLYVSVTTPPGATLERTDDVLDQIYELVIEEPSVEAVSTLSGYSILTESSGASYGMAMINMVPWKERKESTTDLMEKLAEKVKHLNDADIEFFPPPTVPGFGNASGFELRLIDKTGTGDLNKLARISDSVINLMRNSPAIAAAFSSFNVDFPQYIIHVDYDAAAKKGVSVDNAMSTLQTFIGSFYTSNFIRFGQMYKVMLQASPEYRVKPENLKEMYVKNDRGEMVSFSTFIRLERTFGPEQITRYNMYNSVLINGDAAAGFSSGAVIAEAERILKETLPKGYTFEWSGMTREEILAGNQTLAIFVICLLFVYLLLAAQYESFLLPLAVILSLPTGIFGAYLFLYLTGMENNIYAQVALIMLIGLLGKNAILIVEYSKIKIEEGKSVIDATIEGAIARLRPILMTSFAFIAGLIPLAIASGAGALGNRSIGISSVGGMIVGTLFGVVVIPGLFFLFASISERKRARRLEQLQINKTEK
jgi:hydrophobic/amphiphilic exporter-1 (mainly G- bacteria), HAE1 family